MTPRNPLTDELTAEAKADLSAHFAYLRNVFPPVTFERRGGWTFTRPIATGKPWQ